MKQEIYRLINDNVKNNAVLDIRHRPCDGTIEIVIQDARGKSAHQRGLNWLWNGEVAKAGIGGQYTETKDDVHLWSKRKFGIPILCRDDPELAEMWMIWKENHMGDEGLIFRFVELVVHTEKFTVSQMADYLTEYQQFWISKGAQLSDPDDIKLLKATQ